LIPSDPAVLSGQAVIAGTRVPVSVVLDSLAAAMSAEQFVAEYPTLTAKGVRTAAAYGALLAREELVPLTPERGSNPTSPAGRRRVTPSADFRTVDPIGYVHASSPARSLRGHLDCQTRQDHEPTHLMHRGARNPL
jgi:uncharacterized protein (DUF433 family)